MATETVLINAQSIGTSTNVGNNKFSINPVTLQTSTTAFYLDVKLANGATAGDIDPGLTPFIRYANTVYTVTAAEAPNTLGQAARFVKIVPRSGASKEVIAQSSLEPAIGGSDVLCWVDAPAFPVAGALTVTLCELP
jgi:hypothetical protein